MGQANTAVFPRCWQEVHMQHTFSLEWYIFLLSLLDLNMKFPFAQLYGGLKHMTATVSFSS